MLTYPRVADTFRYPQFSDAATSTQGFIARDDTNEQIIVSFRGSQQTEDFLIGKRIYSLSLYT